MKFELKKKIIQIAILFIVMACTAGVTQRIGHDSDGKEIKRPEPGEGAKQEQIDVLDENGNLVTSVDLYVDERELSKDSVDMYFENAYEEVMNIIPGNNESLDCVREKLYLPDKAQNGIINLEWFSNDYSIINYNGVVNNYDFDEDEKREVTLRLVMSYKEYEDEREITAVVLPPAYTDDEWFVVKAERTIKQAEEENPQADKIILPDIIDNRNMTYKKHIEKTSPYIFIVLGILAATLLVYSGYQKKKKMEKNRKRELIYDYSEIVSKLTLLLGAGMTTRMAWNKITADYRKKREAGIISNRCVYDEMLETENNMLAGISEYMAYEQFGKRCSLKEYMKLATLLQTNIKKGTQKLRELLEQEAEEAFEKRKNLARTRGEEATTKMLFPMMIMLMVVMAVIMIPALMQFNV